jgi:Sel1 repeat
VQFIALRRFAVLIVILSWSSQRAIPQNRSSIDGSAQDAWIKARTLEGQEKFTDALSWYQTAFNKGNLFAAADIGFFYEHGLGMTVSLPTAARWYEEGTAAQDPVAKQRLAKLLFSGYGVPKDTRRAVRLIEESADHGDSDAAFGLAMLYQNGAPGYPAQAQEAAHWFQAARTDLRNGDALCSEPRVRSLFAASMAQLLSGSYTARDSSSVFAMLAGTGFPLPSADARAHQPEQAEAIVRHTDSEAECEATFSVDPRNWTFRVNRLRDGSFLVINATGTQWFRLIALRAEMTANGIPVPMGLQNLHDFDAQTSSNPPQNSATSQSTQQSSQYPPLPPRSQPGQQSSAYPPLNSPAAPNSRDGSQAALNPPRVMHWCSQHCSTWTLDTGPPFDKPHYGSEASGGIVIVERFTRESVIMLRTDYRPYPGKAILKGQLSSDGNTIVNGTIEWTYHPCCGLSRGRFQAAWGPALNSVPGSDAQRDARR